MNLQAMNKTCSQRSQCLSCNLQDICCLLPLLTLLTLLNRNLAWALCAASGHAPLCTHLGRRLGWMLRVPRRGMSRKRCGSMPP